MSKSILLAGLFHESHTFVDEITKAADFEIIEGERMLACSGDSSPLGGFLEFAEREGWKVLPAVDGRALPGGIVEQKALDDWWRRFEEAWKPECDAVFLVLHGAMVSEEFRDVEGEILERIRRLSGGAKPIFGVYDLHANFSKAMSMHADCLVAYREHPHLDARDSSVRAASLLKKCLQSERPKIHLKQTKILLPPTSTGTADEPMRSLEASARSMEGGEVWSVNVNAGFGFADTPDSGLSFQLATTGTEEEAEALLEQLDQLAESLKPTALGMEKKLSDVIPLLREQDKGMTLLVETADNIGGGAPGDCTSCLRALLEAKIENAAICICDPQAVERLESREEGAAVKISIGGKGSCLDPGPVELEVKILSKAKGRFELQDKQSHLASMSGDFFDMGNCAVVRAAGVTILLTSVKTPPFDLGQWLSQGIDPKERDVVVVKAAVAHRRAYDPITARSFAVDTPGPCSSNLSRFAYRHLRQGMWPLNS